MSIKARGYIKSISILCMFTLVYLIGCSTFIGSKPSLEDSLSEGACLCMVTDADLEKIINIITCQSFTDSLTKNESVVFERQMKRFGSLIVSMKKIKLSLFCHIIEKQDYDPTNLKKIIDVKKALYLN